MQLDIRLILNDEFEYRLLDEEFTESELESYRKWIYSGFNNLCNKNMNNKLNSEWVVRHYLAAKMTLSATVMLSSLQYCIDKNVKMSVPYLSYYSVLTCCRAIIFTLPEIKWDTKKLLEMPHSKIMNHVKNALMKLNKEKANKIYFDVYSYKKYRELFSYRFPAQGLHITNNVDFSYSKTVELCTLLVELAQFNSKVIESYVRRNCMGNVSKWVNLDMDYLKHCFCYKFDNYDYELIDDEDWYRIDYIRRRQPLPVSIYYTMTEGMVEDFFGAWCSENDCDGERYDPDNDWRIIFPVP